MKRIVIFGNSGSGKSTTAKTLCRNENLAHLDLDTLAWEPTQPPKRKPLEDSGLLIAEFIGTRNAWVIEGCYSDLIQLALAASTEIVFMDLPVEQCIANARTRPWEPHKYATKEEQDNNLEMLIEWIAQYPTRDDTFSETAHRALYNQYRGKKRVVKSNTSCD